MRNEINQKIYKEKIKDLQNLPNLIEKSLLIDNDIQAIQMASAATPDGCRSTYEEITEEQKSCLMEKEPMVQNEEDLAVA